MIQRPFNLKKWIDENRHLLKPPVGNTQIYKDSEFIIMVVGGPNNRKDYHYNEGEEFFYQIEGDVNIRIIENNKPTDVHLKEGDIFLLPPRVPHSPQRGKNTVGLVIERIRKPEEKDGFLWYCENCGNKMYEEYEYVEDIVKQLPAVFDRFYNNQENSTCKSCNTRLLAPERKA